MTDSDSDSEISSQDEEVAEEPEVTNEERLEIKEKLSSMSFEDLIKLKEKIGAKLYNETVFGDTNKAKNRPKSFKRANKNRPREMSSKMRVKLDNKAIPVKKKVTARDPRFDPLCGSYDDKSFKDNYKFLKDVRINEKKQLQEELKNTTDENRKNKIKYLIQRMDNQIREQEKSEKIKQERYEEKKEIWEKLKRGEKPVFKKKSVKRIESLINKYEELKKTNKLQKHIERKSKKLASKHKKQLD